MPIRAIAFDLDDTLMDTTGILVPNAAKNAFQILIAAGLTLTLDECEEKRTQLVKSISHKEVFAKLAAQFGTAETIASLNHANKAFYEPALPQKLPLLDGAIENIEILKKKYNLYVVTAGFESAQNRKIKALGIDHHFKKIFVVNSLEKERKISAFLKILELENILPSQLLCIGNSLSSEITDAKILGAVSCYFEFGEDRGAVSAHPDQKPTFHIHHHREMITACKL